MLAMTLAMVLALAGSPAKAEVDARCKAGSSPAAAPVGPAVSGVVLQKSGLTPASVPGGTRISVGELDCLSKAYGDRLLLLSAMELGEPAGLPGSMTILGGGNTGLEEYDASTVQIVKDQLDYLTSGDLDRPMVAYCRHSGCFESFNLLQRAAKAGYRNLYWLRGGLQEWSKAGRPLGLIGMSYQGLGDDTITVVSCASWSQTLIKAGLLEQDRYDAFIKPHADRILGRHPEALIHSVFDAFMDTISRMTDDMSPYDLSPEQLRKVRADKYAQFDGFCRDLDRTSDLY